MDELKPNQAEKIKVPSDELRKRIGKNMSDADTLDFIFKAVDFYVRHLQKQREQNSR